jgi:type II secretory pathway pseudopilin PulG
MNKLPKEKRDQLILVGLGTLLLLVLIIFALIRPQYAAISDTNKQISDARQRLQSMEDTIKMAGTVSTQLADLSYTLTQNESDLVTGDPAQWIYNTIRNFKEHHSVDISVNSQLSMGEVDLLPHFPYKQLKVTVGGTAYYHDLGKFIADFENTFPHARIANLTLAPTGSPGDNNEKLDFRMDIIALANPTGPRG